MLRTTGSGSLSEGAVATATEGVAPSGREPAAKPSEGEREKNPLKKKEFSLLFQIFAVK